MGGCFTKLEEGEREDGGEMGVWNGRWGDGMMEPVLTDRQI